MTTRFQVPATLQQRLEQKATAEGLTIEEALVRAIECWVLEDEVFDLVVNEVLDRARAKIAALLDQRGKDLDALLREGFKAKVQEAPAKPWEPPSGWDDSAEGWE
jgi:hypothetical protein